MVALVADTSLSGARVARELDAIVAIRGKPLSVVSDNGTEPTSVSILRWSQVLVRWVTLAPCFAFVFLGAPLIKKLQDNKALSGALAAITAAVVGVVANLTAWFGLQALFKEIVELRLGPIVVGMPPPLSLDIAAVALAALAAISLFRLKLEVLRTLGITAAAGLALHLTTLL